MANDRMYLKCKGCGMKVLLAKWWGSEWHSWIGDNLQGFMDEHTPCAFEHDLTDCDKNQQFELEYESQN